MKIILSLFLLLFIPSYAQSQSVDSLLNVLDDYVEKKGTFRAERHRKIDSLEHIISITDKTITYEMYEELFNCNSHFKTDSALYYLECMSNLEEVKSDKKRSISVQLDKAEQLAIMGAFYNAREIVNSIKTDGMDDDIRARYYHVCRTIYGWSAGYLSKNSELNKQLLRMTHHYRDSIMRYERDEIAREIVHADYLLNEGHAEEAKDILLKYTDKATGQNKAYCLYNLSMAYKALRDTDNQMRCLIQTAIHDFKSGVTEYAALPDLLLPLMERGDFERAYKYLLCSMEDAEYCDAVFRSLELSSIYPILEKERNLRDDNEKKNYMFFLLTLGILSVLLIAALLYLRKEMNKLSNTREQLAEANTKLEEANTQLQGTNMQLMETNTDLSHKEQVKEEYIAMFIGKCRKYIGALENYRRSLLKLAKSNQSAALLKMLKDDALIEVEEENFYKDFDEAFLDIHPNFIDNFNALLKPEDRITPKKNELLNAELRIFALIRLGITDTAKIAEFLNYSMPTIYNYRSRIRNKSVYDKEEFDKKVMEL